MTILIQNIYGPWVSAFSFGYRMTDRQTDRHGCFVCIDCGI